MNLLARCSLTFLAAALLCAISSGQGDEKKKSARRFGFDVDQVTFPQKTPAEAMKSIGLALDRKKVDYLLAHMTDPGYVNYWVERYWRDSIRQSLSRQNVTANPEELERRVQAEFNSARILEAEQGKESGGRLLAYDRLTRETNLYFQNDPLIVKDLRIFAKDAKWEEKDDIATGTVETIAARKVFLRKVGERWFLKNEQQ